jgi:hypothetical protein
MNAKSNFVKESIEELQQKMIAESILRVDAAEKDFSELEGKRTEKIYHVLSDIYKEYHQFKDTDLEEPYFEELENFLSSKGHVIQSDTSHALMIVKAVFEGKPSVKKEQKSKYAKVIQLAKVREIQPEEFFDWVKVKGIENISRNKEELPKTKAERSSLERARTLILQWLEVKDAKPVSVSDISIEDMPTSEISSDRFELAICKLRPHPHDKTKAQLHTYWLLPRTEKNEKGYLKDLAWAILPKLEDFEALVQEGSAEVFGDAVQRELDYAEQKGLALEQYLRVCERQNAHELATGQGMGNAFTKPFIPPKRKK